jgi:hypothetical protein
MGDETEDDTAGADESQPSEPKPEVVKVERPNPSETSTAGEPSRLRRTEEGGEHGRE